MTVSSPTTYPEQYDCNGVLTDFDFHFGVSESSEVEVILMDSAGVETDITSSCTFAAANDDFSSGGTVTAPEAYATGNTITLRMKVPVTQESEFTEEMDTLYELFEDGLDKLTRIAQQIRELAGRCLSFPSTMGVLGEGVLPTPEDEKFLRWDGTSGALVNGALAATSDLTDWTTHTADAGAHDAAAQAVTIGAAGVLALGAYPTKNYFQVSAETGTSDTLVSLSGRSAGEKIYLIPASGHTILVAASAAIVMNGDFFLNSIYDELSLRCYTANIFVERYRSGNA